MEAELVGRVGIPYKAISAAGVHGVGLRNLPRNLWQLSKGYFEAGRLINEFKPHVMFFTGGYVAVPVALAGRDIATVLYVPDIEPGLALKFLARFADRIALTTAESKKFYANSAPLAVTGYPVRAALAKWDRKEAYQVFSLSPDIRTLLVFGGSKGARSINRALMAVLPELLNDIQVIHISGALDWPDVQQFQNHLSPDTAKRYRAYPYLHQEMGAAFTISDLVLARAGASTLGEFPLFGLPAILVPYPFAWRYQQVNAQHLAKHGAAIVIEDHALQEKLFSTVRGLMSNENRRAQMQTAMRALAQPDAAASIAQILLTYGAGEGWRGMN
jgi:UDP-N-acetylglucosamine--N-acetylmuramyl-(pentapeptide) pyrophosphoryl-undecaprenol N-acetylglucosamine transferase